MFNLIFTAMNYSEFAELCKAKNVKINDVCAHIEMTRPGLTKALDNQTIELRKLKLLCDYLRVSPSLFFEVGNFRSIHKQDSQNSENPEILKKEIDYLKQSLVDKDEIISLLKKQNSSYGVVAAPEMEIKLKK